MGRSTENPVLSEWLLPPSPLCVYVVYIYIYTYIYIFKNFLPILVTLITFFSLDSENLSSVVLLRRKERWYWMLAFVSLG